MKKKKTQVRMMLHCNAAKLFAFLSFLASVAGAAPTTCVASYKLYNTDTDLFVADLSNGTTVTIPPRMRGENYFCRRSSIEAVVSCGDNIQEVVFELYQDNVFIRRRFDRTPPYFFFGNNGTNIGNGYIAPGTYNLRNRVTSAGIHRRTPFTRFTIEGGCFTLLPPTMAPTRPPTTAPTRPPTMAPTLAPVENISTFIIPLVAADGCAHVPVLVDNRGMRLAIGEEIQEIILYFLVDIINCTSTIKDETGHELTPESCVNVKTYLIERYLCATTSRSLLELEFVCETKKWLCSKVLAGVAAPIIGAAIGSITAEIITLQAALILASPLLRLQIEQAIAALLLVLEELWDKLSDEVCAFVADCDPTCRSQQARCRYSSSSTNCFAGNVPCTNCDNLPLNRWPNSGCGTLYRYQCTQLLCSA